MTRERVQGPRSLRQTLLAHPPPSRESIAARPRRRQGTVGWRGPVRLLRRLRCDVAAPGSLSTW